MISITHYTDLIVLQVIIISFVTCEDTIIDYDLPTKHDSNYSDYYFRPCARYDQQKLTPNKFFKSIYNLPSRVLPEPHSPQNYKLYKKQFKEKKDKIELHKLLKNQHKAKKREKSSTRKYMDERYAYKDPNYYQATDEIYYESKMYKKEYATADEFLNDSVKQEPLNEEIFANLLQLIELAPKHYETRETFYEARVKLGKFLIDNTPLLKNSNKTQKKNVQNSEYETDLVELSTKDVLIKGESYGQYVLRIVSQGKVPLDRKTCEELYKVQFPDETPNRMFRDISLKLTSQPFDKSSSQIQIPPSSLTQPENQIKKKKPSKKSPQPPAKASSKKSLLS